MFFYKLRYVHNKKFMYKHLGGRAAAPRYAPEGRLYKVNFDRRLTTAIELTN